MNKRRRLLQNGRQRSHSRAVRRFGAGGFETLETRIQPAALPLISEVMASNDTTLLDEDGSSPDWIEIFNAGDATLDLAGWHLTDDPAVPEMWTFPAVTVDPGQFLVVFASDKNRADADGTELHTNFKLSSSGDYLALVESDGNTVAYEYAPTLPALQTDVSYGLSMSSSTSILVDDSTALTYQIPTSGSLGTTWTQLGFNDATWNGASGPTLTAGIGYETNAADYDDFIDTPIATGTATFYSRFDFNVTDPAQLDSLNLGMIYDDGFVAHINGTEVAGSDNAPANPQWDSVTGNQRPDDTVIEDFIHFDLTQHLGLLQAGNNVLAIHGINTSANSSDMLIIPELTAGQTSSVTTQQGFFSTPTPGTANGQSFDGFVADTNFSVKRGFYTAPFNVGVITATPGATIVYTLDGSEPTVDPNTFAITNGQLYGGQIPISETVSLRAAAFKPGFEPTNIDTQTYIFSNDVINQDFQHALDLGMPATWDGDAADYGINVVAGHENDFANSLIAVPTISISIDADELFDAGDGIYSNSTSRGRAWERAASIELIYPDGTEGFQEDAGLRIQGGAFRNYGLTPKNSLRLVFRGEYGPSKLNYPIFGADAPDEFDNLILRMESNDGWQWAGGSSEKLFARDSFGRETQLAMGHPAPSGTRMHVYLNGHYWGLYNPVERPDESFAETHYGGDKDDYDVIKSGELQEGSINAWDTLVSLSQSISSAANEQIRTAIYQQILGNNPDGTPNANYPVYLDATNYVDYMITNYYGGNNDWPRKNYAMVRDRTEASEGFKFIMWDSEWSLGLNSAVTINRLDDDRGVAEPYIGLRDSLEFQTLFADRVHKHFFNDGVLTPTNAIERFDEIIDAVEPGLWGESGRWGDQHQATPKTPDVEWAAEVINVRNNYFPQRSDIVVGQFTAASLYSSVDSVTWNQRGGTVAQNFGVTLSAPQGSIYYTTDGSDPRDIGGGISSNAILYTGAFNLPVPTTVNARVLSGGVWSAIDEAVFVSTVPSDEQLYLRVTEIHYHPAEPDTAEQTAGFLDDGQFEFIELTNTSSNMSIDLAGVTVTDGVTATFPLTAPSLAPGGRVLLVSDLAAFTFRYGQAVVEDATFVLEYTGQLNNAGEQIQLNDQYGIPISIFTYQDGNDVGEEDWATAADGLDTSLVIVNPNGDFSDGTNWTISGFPHGTPAAGQTDRLAGDYDRDNDVDQDDRIYWATNFGTTEGIGLFADGNVNGIVDAADFVVWRDNLGSNLPLALATSVRIPRAAPTAMPAIQIVEGVQETGPDSTNNIQLAAMPVTSSTSAFESPRYSVVDLVFGTDEWSDDDES